MELTLITDMYGKHNQQKYYVQPLLELPASMYLSVLPKKGHENQEGEQMYSSTLP